VTRKFYDDPFTLLHLDTSAVRPTDIYVEDVLNLDGTELTPDFCARIDNELLKITAVVLDGGGAGVDKWTVAHLGGAAASIHKAGAQVDVVLTANDMTVGLADYFLAIPVGPVEGDLLYFHLGAWSRLPIGANNAVLTSDGTDPSWVVPTDDDTAYAPLAGATFTGDVEFEAQIVDDTEASGSDGQVLTKVSGHPRWAAATGGMTNPMTTTGDMIYSSPGSTPVRLPIGSAGQVLGVSGGIPAWVADPGGGGGGSGGIAAKEGGLYRNAAYAFTTGAYTKFPFDTLIPNFNNTNMVAASSRYVADVAGVYHVDSHVTTDGTGVDLTLVAYVNGTLARRGGNDIGGGFNNEGDLSCDVYLAVNDYVEVFYYAINAGNADITNYPKPAANYFTCYRVAGASMLANNDFASMYRNAALTLTGDSAWHVFPVDSSDFDPNSLADVANNRFIIKNTGYYLVGGQLQSSPANTRVLLSVWVDPNTGTPAIVRRIADNGSGSPGAGMTLMHFNANDKVYLYYLALAGTALYVADSPTSTSNWFTIARVDAASSNTGAPTSMAALVSRDGATSYWKLTEGSGTSFADTYGGITGTGHNTTASSTGGPFSSSPNVSFNGTTSFIDFGALPLPKPNFSTPVTLELWIKPTASTFVGLIDTAPSAGGTWRNYNTGFFEKQAGTSLAIPALSTSNWTHLAFVFYNDPGVGDQLFIYVNGVRSADSGPAQAFRNPAWTTAWVLGNINGGSAGWFSGKIAHFAIYPKALSPSQIADHAAATSD
jgi:hypothetical protein